MKSLSFILSFLIFSCASQDNQHVEGDLFSEVANAPSDENIRVKSLKIDTISLPKAMYAEQSYQIALTYTLPNSCYSFSSVIQSDKNNEIKLTIAAKVEEDFICAQEIKVEQKKFQLKTGKKGDYILKIFKGKNAKGEAIFEEIKILVLEK